MYFQDSDILNMGTGSVSWFEVHGWGCKADFPTNITFDDPYRPIRPEKVEGCLLDYHLIEIAHSGVQSFLAVSIDLKMDFSFPTILNVWSSAV